MCWNRFECRNTRRGIPSPDRALRMKIVRKWQEPQRKRRTNGVSHACRRDQITTYRWIVRSKLTLRNAEKSGCPRARLSLRTILFPADMRVEVWHRRCPRPAGGIFSDERVTGAISGFQAAISRNQRSLRRSRTHDRRDRPAGRKADPAYQARDGGRFRTGGRGPFPCPARAGGRSQARRAPAGRAARHDHGRVSTDDGGYVVDRRRAEGGRQNPESRAKKAPSPALKARVEQRSDGRT